MKRTTYAKLSAGQLLKLVETLTLVVDTALKEQPKAYMSPSRAAPVLGFPSVEALHAYLRRHKDQLSRVQFPGGVFAEQVGRRWFVRFPGRYDAVAAKGRRATKVKRPKARGVRRPAKRVTKKKAKKR